MEQESYKQKISMVTTELMSTLLNLPRADKFQIIQTLIAELAKSEPELIPADQAYPVWSPYNATEAAATMLQILDTAHDVTRR